MIEPTWHPVWAIPRIAGVAPSGKILVDLARPGLPSAIVECTEEELATRLAEREKLIRLEKDDPLRYGYEPDHWRDADALVQETRFAVCVFGGNRAGKSSWGLKRAMKLLATRDAVDVLILQNNELSSKQLHQKEVYKLLPPEWRNMTKRSGGNIRYDAKTGFSDNIFTTPLGGTCIFGNYGQELEKYEGLQFDLIVADENMPLKWYLGLLRCLADRNGKILWLFTPIDGMTSAINEVAGGARTIKSLPVDPDLLPANERLVDDCPPGHMPYIAKAGDVRIIYFHSVLNPFGNYENLKGLYGGKSKEVRERRFYGFARKTAKVAFPKFGDAHVVPHERLMARIGAQPVSRYHVMDPAGSRNMFMLWVAVTADNFHFVYREWPDVPRFGEWAVPSEDSRRWDGDPGPAQPAIGLTIPDYKRLILTEECNRLDGARGWDMRGEEIVDRLIDPRSGSADSIADREGGSSLIARMEQDHEDSQGVLIGPALYFRPAPGLPEGRGIDGDTEGTQGINDLLGYDEGAEIVAGLNEPRLYISDRCENLIWAMRNYTGNDGSKAACKDPIDCLRYIVTAKLEHLDADMLGGRAGGRF